MQRFIVPGLFAALMLQAPARAARPPIQQDVDRCTFRQQDLGKGSLLQGTVRLQLLVRPNGRPYAAFVWSERGIDDRQLEGCLVNMVPIWELPKSQLDYSWPYPISFAPASTDFGGGVRSYDGTSTAQGRASAFLPDFGQPPPPDPLNVQAAQATLDVVEDATSAEHGLAELAVRRYPQALQLFRSALSANATDPIALRGLAQALAESGGDLKEARATAEKLISLNPDSEQGHEALLRVCLASNDDPCAVQQFNLANRSKDLSLRYLVLRDELQPRAVEASKRVRAAMALSQAAAPAGSPPSAAPQDPCAAEKGDEQQALCVVKRCLDEGTALYARELSEQNHIPYDLGDWRVRTVAAGKLLVTRPIAPKDKSKDAGGHDAIWLVKLGEELVMQPSSPEARQITLSHNRCTARASR